MLPHLQPVLGLLAILTLCWLASENRRAVRPRLILVGLALQFLLALLLLKLPLAQTVFLAVNNLALMVVHATGAGTSMVFGYLGGGTAPFDVSNPAGNYVLAFQALPLILVMSALSALLFYWGILQKLVQAFAWVLRHTLGTGGALGLGAAANVFIGMTEAPLLIRPYLASLPRPALFGLMTCGMATIAGTVMVLYASFLTPTIPDAMGHILAASLISAPAALVVAGMLIPEEPDPAVAPAGVEIRSPAQGTMDAITRGTVDAIPLWLNIIAMLVVMVALVDLLNQFLALLPAVHDTPLTLQRMLGWLMAPVVWLIGIPWSEATTAGALMGIKTVLNEMLAYLQLAQTPADVLSERSRLIMTYALCGFANFGSLGIMIGGLGAMVPERRPEIVALGMRSLVSGTLATLMTGAVVALIL